MKRTVTSLTCIFLKILKRETILVGQFSRNVRMCVYQYQVPSVDLFLHLGIFAHVC